jgi:hypothetical protein
LKISPKEGGFSWAKLMADEKPQHAKVTTYGKIQILAGHQDFPDLLNLQGTFT